MEKTRTVITTGEWINKRYKYPLSGMLSGEKKEGGKGGRKDTIYQNMKQHR